MAKRYCSELAPHPHLLETKPPSKESVCFITRGIFKCGLFCRSKDLSLHKELAKMTAPPMVADIRCLKCKGRKLLTRFVLAWVWNSRKLIMLTFLRNLNHFKFKAVSLCKWHLQKKNICNSIPTNFPKSTNPLNEILTFVCDHVFKIYVTHALKFRSGCNTCTTIHPNLKWLRLKWDEKSALASCCFFLK